MKKYPFRIWQCGPSKLDEYDLTVLECRDDIDMVVYYYRYEGYSGSGILCAFLKNGTVESANLGHCSCYGPTTDFVSHHRTDSLEDFLKRLNVDDSVPGGHVRTPEDYDYAEWKALERRVNQYLRQKAKRSA